MTEPASTLAHMAQREPGPAGRGATPILGAAPFRHADADLWPPYGLIGFKVRYQTSWSLMWLLDTGVAAVWVAEDPTPTAPVPTPITRRCYLEWCDTCPDQARPAPDADPAPCACHCHQTAATTAS
jgi:hypothetical protein